MKILFITILSCVIALNGIAQTQKKFNGYLKGQFNGTLYDYKKSTNVLGIGFGLQGYMNNETRFKPTIDLTGNYYFFDDLFKILVPYIPFGEDSSEIDKVYNLFVGSAYQLKSWFNVSLTAGPSIIDGKTFLGIKPTVSFFFPSSKNFSFELSYINVFNRIGKNDFGSFSISSGVKIF